jgi:hypothetical protein
MVRTINMHMDLQIVVVGNIFRLETCMNSLVKVPSYSKLNFQGEIFFTQNWCNITLSYQVIDTWQTHLQIHVHVYRPHHCCGDWLTFGCFVPMIVDHDLMKKSFGPMIANHGCWGKHAHIPDNDYWGICLFHVVWTNFFYCNYSYVVHTNIFLFFFINWTLCISDNLSERGQILGLIANCKIFDSR